ncbi:MAG: phosphoribosyl-AMP cyclohydrolase [Deltaproteobacteria bacterium]|nr:phosphoribosyl-AMP cyclohydrolase [Deltaproteobacteria bacterium]MCB9488167.1 phosphoribosyl-AMP cyclohydrolase [Deltaproteobacteria bacterium]
MSTIDISKVKFDDKGLVPVVAQDATTKQVLMVAWANEEALRHTAETGEGCYWSRSRKELWVKGKTSGNTQKVVDIRLDCDGDTLIYMMNVAGPACHFDETTCFFRRNVDGEWVYDGDHDADPGYFDKK